MSIIQGPYTACLATLSGECIGFHITTPKMGSVAPLADHRYDNRAPYTSEEIRATGHLLAASWDLLEAAEYAYEECVDLIGTDAGEKLLAAIAKARGEGA